MKKAICIALCMLLSVSSAFASLEPGDEMCLYFASYYKSASDTTFHAPEIEIGKEWEENGNFYLYDMGKYIIQLRKDAKALTIMATMDNNETDFLRLICCSIASITQSVPDKQFMGSLLQAYFIAMAGGESEIFKAGQFSCGMYPNEKYPDVVEFIAVVRK